MKGDTASGMKQSVQWHNKQSNEACKPELISHRHPNKVDGTRWARPSSFHQVYIIYSIASSCIVQFYGHYSKFIKYIIIIYSIASSHAIFSMVSSRIVYSIFIMYSIFYRITYSIFHRSIFHRITYSIFYRIT